MSFSQNITSPLPDANVLFDPVKAIESGQKIQQNQLGLQGQQLDLSNANMQQVNQAAAGLLSAYPDEASRAAAYPKVIGQLQSQGFAMHAPSQYPGEATLRAMVNMGLSPKELYASGVLQPPGLADALARANAPLPGQAAGGGTAAPAAGGFAGQLAQSESGGKPGIINSQGYTGLYQFGKQRLQDLGYYTPASGENMADNTNWAGKVSIPGFNVTDQASFAANPAAQNAAFNAHVANIDQAIAQTPGAARFDPNGLRAVAHLGGINGMQKFVASGGSFSPSDANGTTLLGYYNKFAGGAPSGAAQPGTATASAVPPAAVPTAPGAATALPAPDQFAGPGAPTLPPAATDTGQPTPAPAAAAPQPGSAQPAVTPPTGVNSPQFQAALELNNRATALEAQYPTSLQVRAEVAGLRAKAALYMQADSVTTDPTTGIQTKQLTGERLNAAAPNAHYVWNAEQGAFVDTTGTHPPVTPPSPRITYIPGVGAVQSKSGGGATVVVPMNPAGITAQSAAQAAGTAAGSETGKLTGQLADQGRTSTQAIGNIDYGLSQLAKAQQGGINTGYFAPWLATVGAVAKSLGVPTEAIGVDPAAVGNIQTAQKTLAVVSGAILQQVLGPDSQITDAKLSHFIHAQPGIETDPEAVSRVLNWARSQFVYEREQAAQGMKDAAASGGVLPTSWESSYYDKHGFAPIYNPGTGEMQQPDGTAPPRTAPPATQTAPVNPSNRTAGTTYNTPKGPLKWTGTGWVTP